MSSSKKVSKTLKLIIFLLLVCAGIGYLVYQNGWRRNAYGTPEPIQEEASGSTTMHKGGYTVNIEYKASYKVDALVVHRKKYSDSGLGGKLSPVDLALAWGKVAENNTKINFHWHQSGRWYSWHVNDLDELIPVGDVENVEQSSANTHIIPANDTVERTVKKIRRGDRVKLEGYLVFVNAVNDSGATFTWNSSLTREDTGDGSCEVFYVTKAEIV